MFVCVCMHAHSRSVMYDSCNTTDCSLPGSSVHGGSPVRNTGVDFHALLQRVFLAQGSHYHLLSLLYWRGRFFTASVTWEAHIYIFPILFQNRFLYDIEYSSLCYTIDPHWLSILFIIVCIC